MIPQPHISIFEVLKHTLGDRLNTVMLTKATLVHLSHTLEDFVLQRHLPAMIFTGFQESSHWREETARYQQLADVAMQVCIFAGKPLPPDEDVAALQIELTGDDPLRQEWFLAILSTDFTVVLAGLDNMEAVSAEAYRRFETVWSFDVEIVNAVLDTLEGVIAHYRPAVLPRLQDARRTYPSVEPKSEVIVKFATELMRFEDKLRHEIQRRTEELKISEAHYRSVVGYAPVAVLSVTADGVIQLVEDNAPRPLFASQAVTPGDHIDTLYAGLPPLADIFAVAQATETTYATLETDDGYFDVHTTRFHQAGIQRIIITFVDVTERQHILLGEQEQERLRLSLAQEQEMSAIRRQLMITLSHELRTPLAAIQTSSDLLARYYDRLEPAKRQERLAKIQHQVQHLKHILDDINAVIRDEDMPFGGEAQPVDVAKLVAETIVEISETTGRKVLFLPSGGLNGLRYDPRMLHYVISNLVSNALKYSAEGRPVICKVERHEAVVVIVVQDYGIGIPPDEQTAVFKPFYRASNVGTIGGTGLGLSIIHNTVTNMGGNIEIASQLDEGTTVTITLPAQAQT